jgi:rhodanese-related sulfurtransferase
MTTNTAQPLTLQDMVAAAKAQITEVDVSTLKQRMAQEPNLVVIDVREIDEWPAGTIPGAQTLSRGVIEFQIDRLVPDRTTPIVCYCGGGSRSALAAQTLQQMGYTNVASLTGGWRAWSAQ